MQGGSASADFLSHHSHGTCMELNTKLLADESDVVPSIPPDTSVAGAAEARPLTSGSSASIEEPGPSTSGARADELSPLPHVC